MENLQKATRKVLGEEIEVRWKLRKQPYRQIWKN